MWENNWGRGKALQDATTLHQALLERIKTTIPRMVADLQSYLQLLLTQSLSREAITRRDYEMLPQDAFSEFKNNGKMKLRRSLESFTAHARPATSAFVSLKGNLAQSEQVPGWTSQSRPDTPESLAWAGVRGEFDVALLSFLREVDPLLERQEELFQTHKMLPEGAEEAGENVSRIILALDCLEIFVKQTRQSLRQYEPNPLTSSGLSPAVPSSIPDPATCFVPSSLTVDGPGQLFSRAECLDPEIQSDHWGQVQSRANM